MKQRLYRLLMVEHRALLDACYRSVFYTDGAIMPIKTFDDCLSDFYLYLLEAKPKRVGDDVEGYYLQQVKDEKALPEWLRQTFRRFLLHEHEILVELQSALAEYRLQLANQRLGEHIDITLMHVSFALAWFNQHESETDRYLFFRSAYKHFSGFYEWPDDDLNDADVSRILGLSPGNLRTRTSRLTAKVRRLVYELNDAAIATLNSTSLDIAHSIYRDADPDIEDILRGLLDKAERQLPQYAEIVSLRKSKRRPILSTGLINSLYRSEEEDACLSPRIVEESCKPCVCCEPSPYYKPCEPCESSFFDFDNEPIRTENRIVRLFKEFIGL